VIKITKIWTEGLEVDEGEQVREQDINQILIASKGFHVETGLEVHETSGTPNDYVQVDSGSAWLDMTKVTVSATTSVGPFSTVSASGKERIDAVVIDNTGTLNIVSGTEADSGQAKPPNVPEDKVVLAFVTINEDTTVTVLDADIEDRRVFKQSISQMIDNYDKYYLVQRFPMIYQEETETSTNYVEKGISLSISLSLLPFDFTNHSDYKIYFEALLKSDGTILGTKLELYDKDSSIQKAELITAHTSSEYVPYSADVTSILTYHTHVARLKTYNGATTAYCAQAYLSVYAKLK